MDLNGHSNGHSHDDDDYNEPAEVPTYMTSIQLDAWRYDRGAWTELSMPAVSVETDEEEDGHDHLETAIEALGYERIGGSEPGNELGQIQLFAREHDAEPIGNAEFAVSVVLGQRNDVVFATDLPSLLMLMRELEPLTRAKLHAAAWVQ